MTNFNINVLDVRVTEWNEKNQDWSGDTFYKKGFHIGSPKSNKLDDVIATINAIFEVEKENVEVNEGGQLIFTIIEDEEGIQDDYGHYMVDYIVKVEKVGNVIIEG